MTLNVMKNIGLASGETALSSAAIGISVEKTAPHIIRAVSGNFLPAAASFAAVNTVLAGMLHVHEKPKIVQIAFPFFSGLAAAGLISAFGFPTTVLFETYLLSSTMLAGIALIKVMAKAILKKQAEPKEESKPHRVFNYVVAGAATFSPSVISAKILEELLGREGFAFGFIGVFFGLAQVCVSTLLGAPQESRALHSFLPVITSLLPWIVFGVMEGIKHHDETAFIVITAISILTALIGTVAARHFAKQPQAAIQIETLADKKTTTPAHNYVRWGSAAMGGSSDWEKDENGSWKQKAL